jgi:hypothetical protein
MLCDYLKPRPQLEAEIVILRHQLNLLQRRAPRRPHLRWVAHSKKPSSAHAPRLSVENPLWGAPRIHGELLKLGFEVAQSSVAKYMVKRCGPPVVPQFEL